LPPQQLLHLLLLAQLLHLLLHFCQRHALLLLLLRASDLAW
jgi:hypothetical protein